MEKYKALKVFSVAEKKGQISVFEGLYRPEKYELLCGQQQM